VPEAFAASIPLAAHQKAADYTCAKVRLNRFELLGGSAILLLWTLAGGLQFLDQAWRALGWSSLATGVAFFLSFMVISGLLDMPLEIYRSFVLEQRFGFNRMSARVFVTDQLKNLCLLIFIGTPMLALVLWLMHSAGEDGSYRKLPNWLMNEKRKNGGSKAAAKPNPAVQKTYRRTQMIQNGSKRGVEAHRTTKKEVEAAGSCTAGTSQILSAPNF